MDISQGMGRLLILVCCLLTPSWARSTEESFVLNDGDQIVFLGSTFFEREGNYGYLETFLTRHFPHKRLTFRNLGYSAETVGGESRAMFDTPREGFERMVDQVVSASPTVLFLEFGQNESYGGEEGLEDFIKGYRRLIEILEASTEARFVVLSPPALETLDPPLPDSGDQNSRLALYVEAIRKLSEEKNLFFIDLYHPLLSEYAKKPGLKWTDNTIHFNPYGYWRVGLILMRALGLEERDWQASLDLENFRIEGAETRFDSIHYDESNGLELLLTDHRLLLPNPPEGSRKDFQALLPSRTLQVTGLAKGTYELRVDENAEGVFSSEELAKGIEFPLGLRESQVERLRKQIRRKSELFFHRWRPQNWTYLFGFRKHEQGQNAKETPMFDPLIAEVEEEIAQTKVPVTYRVELVPTKGGAN